MKHLEVGSIVCAIDEISESDFNGAAVWTHAKPGDFGKVLEVLEDGWVNVRFGRSDTITICHPSEIVLVPAAKSVHTPLRPPAYWS